MAFNIQEAELHFRNHRTWVVHQNSVPKVRSKNTSSTGIGSSSTEVQLQRKNDAVCVFLAM